MCDGGGVFLSPDNPISLALWGSPKSGSKSTGQQDTGL